MEVVNVGYYGVQSKGSFTFFVAAQCEHCVGFSMNQSGSAVAFAST